MVRGLPFPPLQLGLCVTRVASRMEPHLSEVKETNYSLQAACNLDDGELWSFLSFTNKPLGRTGG